MDFALDGWQGTAQLAGTILDASGKLADLLGRLKSALDKPQGGGNTEVEALVEKIGSEIRATQIACELLQTKVLLARHEIAALDATTAKLATYTLHRTASGNFVYAPKEFEGDLLNAPFICPKCFEDRRHSVLQGDAHSKVCKTCAAWFDFEPRPKLRPRESTWL